MNSGKKKDEVKRQPCCKIDSETGKLILLPLKLDCPSETTSAKHKLSDNKPKLMPRLTPLKLTAADFEEPPRGVTKVRKELFNAPSAANSRRSIGRQSLSRRSITIKKVQRRKVNIPGLSPLLDMEEIEDEILNKKRVIRGYPLKSLKKPTIKFNKAVKGSPFAKKVNFKELPREKLKAIPDTVNSNEAEFLVLENMCQVNEAEENSKPIMANSNSMNIQAVIKDIRTIVEENNKVIEQYKTCHEQILEKISELLIMEKNNYGNVMALQEDNSKISDIIYKLEHLSLVQTNIPKVIISTVVTESKDLQKNAINNLVTSQQNQSPRFKKALDLYNSIREDISVLTTPNLDRKCLMQTPKSSTLSKNLSRKVQNQCLLLQDTPVFKK